MRIYRHVHIGANMALGGLNDGLFSVVYQVVTELAVKKAPKAPIARGMAILTTKAMGLNFISVRESIGVILKK